MYSKTESTIDIPINEWSETNGVKRVEQSVVGLQEKLSCSFKNVAIVCVLSLETIDLDFVAALDEKGVDAHEG
jgi:hypothetical protein